MASPNQSSMTDTGLEAAEPGLAAAVERAAETASSNFHSLRMGLLPFVKSLFPAEGYQDQLRAVYELLCTIIKQEYDHEALSKVSNEVRTAFEASSSEAGKYDQATALARAVAYLENSPKRTMLASDNDSDVLFCVCICTALEIIRAALPRRTLKRGMPAGAHPGYLEVCLSAENTELPIVDSGDPRTTYWDDDLVVTAKDGRPLSKKLLALFS